MSLRGFPRRKRNGLLVRETDRSESDPSKPRIPGKKEKKIAQRRMKTKSASDTLVTRTSLGIHSFYTGSHVVEQWFPVLSLVIV